MSSNMFKVVRNFSIRGQLLCGPMLRCYCKLSYVYKNNFVEKRDYEHEKSNDQSLKIITDPLDVVEKLQTGNSNTDVLQGLENVSDYAPFTEASYNFAAYVNKSPTLQEFVKLGVKLYKLEKNIEVAEFILRLDYEKDVKKYLRFLHDVGVPGEKFGDFITIYPLLFKEDIENLQARVNYLESKRFTSEMIPRIITVNPKWLSFKTKDIDYKLGHFQKEFKLFGREVRYLSVKDPKLITYNMDLIKTNTFTIREEMGFEEIQMKILLLKKPRLFRSSQSHVVDRFDFIHNIMKIDHDLIVQQPEVLNCRLFRLQQRHTFLKSLKRAQYDPKQPGYVSLKALVSGNDAEFCKNVAQSTLYTFNAFLKNE